MNSGFYAACAGLIARTQSLDLAANNLANASTVGYRGQHETFRELLTEGAARLSSLNRAVNSFGVLGGAATDMRQGNLERTGDPLDFAIEGPGFFAVETTSGIRYTRDGNFRLRPDRTLVTAAGDAVIGENGPIRVLDGVLNVSADGTMSVNGAAAGKLRLVEFSAGTSFVAVGDGYYDAPKAAATTAKNSSVRQSMLEGSNVEPVTAAVSLISLQRNAEMLQRALSVFQNDFNRVAAEELPRV